MKRRNEKTRLLLTLELAVILPAAALVILSVWHVRHIQRDRAVEAAFQREYSQVLAISEKQINHKAYELMDDVRTEFPTPSELCAPTLDKILAAHPYTAHVFMYSPEGGMVFRSQSSRLKNEQGFRDEADWLNKMYEGWLKIDFHDFSDKLAHMQKKGMPYIFEGEWVPRGDKKVYQSTALFAVKDEKTGSLAIAGAALDADYLKDQFFPQTLDDVINHNVADAQSDKNHAVMMLHGKYESSALAQSTGWDGGAPEVERNLEGAFPGLTLAIKLRGNTLAAIGERFARMSLLTLAALSLALAVGIALTYRNVTKEMALARLKSDFVSNVSHELKTPLTSIRMFAEMMQSGSATEEKRPQYLRIIVAEAERLTRLINNVLDFARLERKQKRYDFRALDLHAVLARTWEGHELHLREQGFTTSWQAAPPPYPVRGDEDALAQILVNLLSNAEKYSTERKEIELHSYLAENSVHVSVLDRGSGVPPGEETKIFEAFYRAHDSLASGIQGSGLGLTLAQRIAKEHGGEITFQAREGGGSNVTLRLPLTTEHSGSGTRA